ncbi:carboxypeptidase regulatory-like domain-containing protein [Flavobacterium arcticum]|uniref:Carboxypeptidase regulatory-like domain-containing protein n=1 Tax=Flavobacterium arcticum TaxID=1784713 RepID=A0A345HD04_9FLAO|nr:carboxypeptidase-like regulatory domain-containing protein [Flavobacterium arcticum]AXG74464.1 carboxypeptidase regulatory-like domain-containing protein [Flavobacterium arcticum]KAF2512416.1 carboxypeptidase regulatory-like domain-containing protein [Flavobacterium arcticum]
MKRIVFLILVTFLLHGCGIDYDGETKNIFEGTITDDSGNPLEGILVEVLYANSNTIDVAGIDVTDANGNYLMITPSAFDEIDIKLQVNNYSYNQSGNNDNNYSTTSVVNITKELIKGHDYKLSFNEIQLFPLDRGVQLNLHFEKQFSHNQRISKVNVVGLVNESYTDYDFNYINDNYRYDLSDYYSDYTNIYTVAKNQTLIVKYMLTGYSVHEVEIPVGEENLEYTITY